MHFILCSLSIIAFYYSGGFLISHIRMSASESIVYNEDNTVICQK